jgi:hypothetical protein
MDPGHQRDAIDAVLEFGARVGGKTAPTGAA